MGSAKLILPKTNKRSWETSQQHSQSHYWVRRLTHSGNLVLSQGCRELLLGWWTSSYSHLVDFTLRTKHLILKGDSMIRVSIEEAGNGARKSHIPLSCSFKSRTIFHPYLRPIHSLNKFMPSTNTSCLLRLWIVLGVRDIAVYKTKFLLLCSLQSR